MFEQLTDPQMWQQVREVTVIALILMFLLACLAALVCAFGLLFCTVPGSLPKLFSLRSWFKPASFRDWVLLSRLNVIFYSELLTLRGLIFRKWLIVSFVAMPIFWAILVLLAP